MKKIKNILIIFLCIVLFPIRVSAASGTISITGTSNAVIGNTVTITVTLSSSTAIGSWDMDLNYDKNYLQLISATSEAGGISMVNSSSGTKSKSYTFKFKALKSGTTKVSMSSYSAYAYDDMSAMNLTAGSKSVKIMTQAELEASYSKDNNLKALSVDGFELNQEFNQDTTSYSVIVPENTTEININATASDSKSSITGAGTQTVTSGTNTFNIIVRAENGSEKTYTLTVEVKDSNPINVTIDSKNYTVVKIREYLPSVNAYKESTININEFEIPAYNNDLTGFTLVGLKDEEGNINLYIYNQDNNSYTKYTELGLNKLVIYPLETDKILKNYKLDTIEIDGLKIPAFYLKDNSRFVIIYGINVETGEEGFYKYDKEDQTAIKFDEEENNLLIEYQEKMDLYSYIIIGFSVIFVIMFIILLVSNKKDKKKKKIKDNLKETPEITPLVDSNEKKEIEVEEQSEDKKDNEIVEINKDNNEVIYDNNQKGKKKNKSKKK